MVNQIPGFSIRSQDQGRGLGQANENVLINGERNTSKSEDVQQRLARINANRVDRIELVDGSTLGIPGLSGQVANVITKGGGISGRFEYRAVMRPHYALDSYGGGEISVSGSGETLEWTAAYSHGVGRGGAGGGQGNTLRDGLGNIIEVRDSLIQFKGEFPRLNGRLKWTSPGGVVANLNTTYGWSHTRFRFDEYRHPVGDVDVYRDFLNRDDGHNYDISADVEFPLGPGKLKLIGIERFNQSDGPAIARFIYDDGRPDEGSRFFTDTKSGERIARGEYRWAMLGGDWQLDGEAAFNRFDQDSTLGFLDPSGEFDIQPFPPGIGKVTEDRYEVILTHSRPIGKGLTLQFGGGAEYSKLAQTGPGGLTRTFKRPKGSVTLAWTPKPNLDLSLKVARTVGQLSFGTFLGNVNLQNDNQNAGNVELVPQQAWEVDFEAKKGLKEWGSVTLRAYARFIQDYIDVIPVPGGESSGNIDGNARLLGLSANATINLDPLGWKGAKITTSSAYEATSLPDPLTGEDRPFSGHQKFRNDTTLRWDVPKSDWAFGAGMSANDIEPYVRLFEEGHDWEGPVYTFAFIEHKDVFGLTVNFNMFNQLGNGHAYFTRTVYNGLRNSSTVAFTEDRVLDVSAIYRLTIRGTF